MFFFSRIPLSHRFSFHTLWHTLDRVAFTILALCQKSEILEKRSRSLEGEDEEKREKVNMHMRRVKSEKKKKRVETKWWNTSGFFPLPFLCKRRNKVNCSMFECLPCVCALQVLKWFTHTFGCVLVVCTRHYMVHCFCKKEKSGRKILLSTAWHVVLFHQFSWWTVNSYFKTKSSTFISVARVLSSLSSFWNSLFISISLSN